MDNHEQHQQHDNTNINSSSSGSADEAGDGDEFVPPTLRRPPSLTTVSTTPRPIHPLPPSSSSAVTSAAGTGTSTPTGTSSQQTPSKRPLVVGGAKRQPSIAIHTSSQSQNRRVRRHSSSIQHHHAIGQLLKPSNAAAVDEESRRNEHDDPSQPLPYPTNAINDGTQSTSSSSAVVNDPLHHALHRISSLRERRLQHAASNAHGRSHSNLFRQSFSHSNNNNHQQQQQQQQVHSNQHSNIPSNYSSCNVSSDEDTQSTVHHPATTATTTHDSASSYNNNDTSEHENPRSLEIITSPMVSASQVQNGGVQNNEFVEEINTGATITPFTVEFTPASAMTSDTATSTNQGRDGSIHIIQSSDSIIHIQPPDTLSHDIQYTPQNQSSSSGNEMIGGSDDSEEKHQREKIGESAVKHSSMDGHNHSTTTALEWQTHGLNQTIADNNGKSSNNASTDNVNENNKSHADDLLEVEAPPNMSGKRQLSIRIYQSRGSDTIRDVRAYDVDDTETNTARSMDQLTGGVMGAGAGGGDDGNSNNNNNNDDKNNQPPTDPVSPLSPHDVLSEPMTPLSPRSPSDMELHSPQSPTVESLKSPPSVHMPALPIQPPSIENSTIYSKQSHTTLMNVKAPKDYSVEWNYFEKQDKLRLQEQLQPSLLPDVHTPTVQLCDDVLGIVEPTDGCVDTTHLQITGNPPIDMPINLRNSQEVSGSKHNTLEHHGHPSTQDAENNKNHTDLYVDTSVILPLNKPTRLTRATRIANIQDSSSLYQPSQIIRGKLSFVSFARSNNNNPDAWNHIRHIILENDSNVGDVEKYLKRCVNIEILEFKNCRKIPSMTCNFPRLQILNVVQCSNIKKGKILMDILSKSLWLHTMYIQQTPLNQSWGNTAVPYSEHEIWNDLLLKLPELEWFNGQLISNSFRYNAYVHGGSKKKIYDTVSTSLWHMAFNNDPHISQLTAWDVTAITELDLTRCSLTSIHLFPVQHSIQKLNVAQNHITTLKGSGLHLCKSLQHLNLSYNEISDVKELHLLRYLPALTHLSLHDNKLPPHTYNTVAIYVCRNLKGTNRLPGLQYLDEKPVSIDDTIHAIQQHTKTTFIPNAYRWRYQLIQLYGHLQLQQCSSVINTMNLSGKLLSYADVNEFPALVSLNLSGNKLRHIYGLEKLQKLKHLDIRGNVELDMRHTVSALQKLQALEHVSLAAAPLSENAMYTHIQSILRALLYSNPKISHIEKRLLKRDDYLLAVQKIERYTENDHKYMKYKLYLSITMDNTVEQDRLYTPAAVQPAMQWNYDQLMTLNISNLQLSNDGIQTLPPMPALTYLNINNNKFKSLCGLIPAECTRLQWIDARNNKIDDTIPMLVSKISTLGQLEGIALNNNPMVKREGKLWRTQFLSSLPMLHQVDCQLRVVDSVITLDERVMAWQQQQAKIMGMNVTSSSAGGGTSADNNVNTSIVAAATKQQEPIFRFTMALQLYAYHNMKNGNSSTMAQSITELNLSSLNLTYIDMTPFISLRKLILHDNLLETVSKVGLEKIQTLVVLDLSNNKIKVLASVLKIINKLPHLVSLSLQNNPYADLNEGTRKNSHLSLYRLNVLSGIAVLRSLDRTLKYIDGQQIQSDEIVEALGSTGQSLMERELFRFDSLVHHCSPDIERLELNNSKLQAALFDRFQKLRYLSLKGNYFTTEMLLDSKINVLQYLEVLDISDNRITSDLSLIAALVETLPKLHTLNISHNPAWNREHKPRRAFLAAFRKIHMVGFSMKILNNEKLTIEERIQAFIYSQKDEFKMKYGFHNRRDSDIQQQQQNKLTMSNPVAEKEPATPGGGKPPTSPLKTPHNRRASEIGVTTSGHSRRASELMGSVPHHRKDSLLTDSVPTSPISSPSTQLDKQALFYEAENARFLLTMEEISEKLVNVGKQLNEMKHLDLSNRQLRMLGPTSGDGGGGIIDYKHIESIDLRNNNISRVDNLGIEKLPCLRMLDVRGNKLHSLKHSIRSLYKCDALRELYILRSTRDMNETQRVNIYHDYVCRELRGLTHCDGIESPYSLSREDPITQEAQQYLYKLAGVGPNTLQHVDISNKGLPTGLFFFTLAALYHLRIRRLQADGLNEWSVLPYYTDCVIIHMGSILEYLDGDIITEQRRGLALKANETRQLDKHKLDWYEVHTEAMEAVADWISLKEEEEKNNAGKLVVAREDALIFHTSNVLSGQSMQAAGQSTQQQIGAISSQVSDLSGRFMSKVEIVIHFVQVYGLVLVMDINIPWPHLYFGFVSWLNVFSFNFLDYFKLDVNWTYVLYASTMAGPGLLMILFLRLSYLRGQMSSWADLYINKWRRAVMRSIAILLLFCIMGLIFSFTLIDNNESIRNIISLHPSPPTSNGVSWTIALSAVFLVAWYCWYWIVKKFRVHYLADQSEDKINIRNKWLNVINWSQIAILFILTALFMPIARVILTQFQCTTVTTTNPDGTTTTQSFSANFPSNGCFPSPITPIQYTSMVTGVIYIIGFPLFYLQLINRTVALVMSTNRADKLLHERSMELESLLKETDDKEEKQKIRSDLNLINVNRSIVYYNTINLDENFVPSTTLYAAYKKPYRHSKLILMFQKLLLVLFALFLPDNIGGVLHCRVIAGNIVVLISFLYTVVCRPYNDWVETLMDGFTGFANTVNVLVALGLQYQKEHAGSMTWLTPTVQNVILFVANGFAVASLVITVLLFPYTYWKSKRIAHMKKEAEERQLEEMKGVKHKAKDLKQRKKSNVVHKAAEAEKTKEGEKVASPTVPVPVSALADKEDGDDNDSGNAAIAPAADSASTHEASAEEKQENAILEQQAHLASAVESAVIRPSHVGLIVNDGGEEPLDSPRLQAHDNGRSSDCDKSKTQSDEHSNSPHPAVDIELQQNRGSVIEHAIPISDEMDMNSNDNDNHTGNEHANDTDPDAAAMHDEFPIPDDAVDYGNESRNPSNDDVAIDIDAEIAAGASVEVRDQEQENGRCSSSVKKDTANASQDSIAG